MKKEQKELTLSNQNWELLIKKISSIVSKAVKLEETATHQTKKRAEQIKDKAIECLDIIKYKNIKDG